MACFKGGLHPAVCWQRLQMMMMLECQWDSPLSFLLGLHARVPFTGEIGSVFSGSRICLSSASALSSWLRSLLTCGIIWGYDVNSSHGESEIGLVRKMTTKYKICFNRGQACTSTARRIPMVGVALYTHLSDRYLALIIRVFPPTRNYHTRPR